MANIFQLTTTVRGAKGRAGLTSLQGADHQWAIDIQRGRALTRPFPAKAYFQMNPKRPKENKLAEQHSNGDRLVVIGPRFSELMRGLGASLQLMPVKILDPHSAHDDRFRLPRRRGVERRAASERTRLADELDHAAAMA
jgi:hypothetical protein